MSFNFGGGAAAAPGGFSFGAPKPATAAAPATSGFSFGTPGASSAANPVGGTTAGITGGIAAGAPSGFSFGAAASQPQSNIGTAQKSTGFTLAGSTPIKPAGQGLNLGLTQVSTGPTAGFTTGGQGAAKPATQTTGLGIMPAATKPAATSAKTGGLTLGGLGTSTPVTKASGLSLGGLGGLGSGTLGSTTPAASKAGGLTLATPATKSGGLTLGGAGATGALGGAKPTLNLGKTTTASTTGAAGITAAPAGPTMNYRELEEAINKWTVELEEQEKVFLQQATQVNAWDRLLVENGEKITVLHNDVEKVKTDQQRLEHELDYIVAQQRELEDMLTPLEESIKTQQGSLFTQHADVEREHTYQLAETIDSQLKRMVQDLKEVIEHLNTSNTAGEANDPIHQIAKILNAHMDSLQWIDHNTAMCQRKVDEIARQSEIVRRDQERNVQLAFD
ncbi:uncharacterized protein [Antedon mediterranea]|uniref:uncharacterized protein n=1 Tax=Antedon mediterranea TaxID=105859 RepID=UPI003AF4BF2B